MNQNWVALRGQIAWADGELRHVPVLPEPTDDRAAVERVAFTEARSDIEFDSGVVRFEVWIEEPLAKCQIALNSGKEPELYAGFNMGASAYGIVPFKNGKWDQGKYTGFGQRPDIHRWIPVEVTVKGSEITLYVDHVRLVSYTESLARGHLGFLFRSNAPIRVRNLAVEGERPTVFVVMQFTPEYDALYTDVIKPTCESFGYRVVRGDDDASVGLIIQDIARSIREAAVILADITPDNPNVFYEVGYAHALDKPTILLSDRKRPKLPFDVSGFRTLFYDNSIGGKRAVEEALTKHLRGLAA